jgi:hypothetical protein
MTTDPTSRPTSQRPAHRPITLGDLTSDLLWPGLLRAPAMALRPDRLGIALFTLVLLAALAKVPALWLDASDAGLSALLSPTPAADNTALAPYLVGLIRHAVLELPATLLHTYPWTTLWFVLAGALALGLGGLALARQSALEFSLRVISPWTRGVGFALSRLGSALVGLLVPPALVALGALFLAAAGWALLSLQYANVLGAILYGLGLLGGLLAVVLAVLYLFSLPMILPAIACESTDGLDALQRAFAYTLARPARLVLYAGILLLQGAIVVTLAHTVASLAVEFTTAAAGAWTTLPSTTGPKAGSGTNNLAAHILSFWNDLPTLLAAAFALSYAFSASTILYLLMRRLCDGQEVSDLWMPTMIPGTHAPTNAADIASPTDGTP